MKLRRKLKKIGKVLHPSPIAPNILIIRVSEYLPAGTIIYDSKLREIGTVIETFGPVEFPYARIKIIPNFDKNKYEFNDAVFIISGEKTRVKWRKMPKRRRR